MKHCAPLGAVRADAHIGPHLRHHSTRDQRSRGAIFFVGARIARPCRVSGFSRRARWLDMAVCSARFVGADAFIGPCRVSGLSWRVRWFWRPLVPLHPKPLMEERGCQRGGLRQPGQGAAHRRPFHGLRRGTFHRGKVPKTRRGLRPPDSLGAVRRASPGAASPWPLRSTGPSRPILPAPSRLRAGQWNRIAVTATGRSSKAAPAAPEQGLDFAHGSFFA